MSRRITMALAGPIVAGAVLLPARPLSGQSEVETIHSSEYGTTVRFRDEDGVLVERFLSPGGHGTIPFISDRFLDDDGDMVRKETRYRDGRRLTEHFAYVRPLPDGGKSLFARARNMSREKKDDFLSRLPPPPITSQNLRRGQSHPADETPLDSGHPWGHHWKESADGVTLTTFRLLHQEIEVESVRLDESWLRLSDSRGGVRYDHYTETATLERPEEGGHSPPLRAVASQDALGRIVQVVTNDEGYPIETWYGETLVARYHYAHVDGVLPLPPWGGLGDFWVELIDARTNRLLLDSRALPVTSAKPIFSALGETGLEDGLIQSVGDDLFAVVTVDETPFHSGGYALLPLGEEPMWRTIQAAGTEAPELRSLVHYTDDRLRIEFRFDHAELVVEAPRRGSSPIKVTWPQDIVLPLLK